MATFVRSSATVTVGKKTFTLPAGEVKTLDIQKGCMMVNGQLSIPATKRKREEKKQKQPKRKRRRRSPSSEVLWDQAGAGLAEFLVPGFSTALHDVFAGLSGDQALRGFEQAARGFGEGKQSSGVSTSVTDRMAGDCVICLEPLNNASQVRILDCLHKFCEGCYSKWERARDNAPCPVCRAT